MRYSFIIATFNGSQYIQETINSLLSQIIDGDEIIIVNDSSTDETKKIVESNKASQIKLINLPKNIGAAGARNEGLKLSTSDYVIFLDSDDLWFGNIYQTINQTLITDPTIDILIGCVEHFFSPEIKDQISNLYKLPPVSKARFGGSLVIKRSALLKSGGFDSAFRNRGEWIDLMSKLLMFEPKILELDTIFWKRRIHNNNMSHKHKDLSSYIPALRESIKRKQLKK
jgi:glycosyltransferase involved in cell wall biosynthesis